ncbi:MAG: chromate transporter [Oscillospiraceae bacterium]|nr:chromate transporter [Oscillospiraceae bacterium]
MSRSEKPYTAENEKTVKPSFFRLFMIFFKIGCVSFGGGFAMMPFIMREVVTKYKWVTSEEIVDIFSVSQSMPGSVAVNSIGIIGYRIYGIKGAAAGTLGVVFPAFAVIMLISAFFSGFKDIVYVQKAFCAVRAAVTALILYAAVKLAKDTIPDRFTFAIALLSFIALYAFKLSAITVIIAAIVAGIVCYFVKRGKHE